MCSSSTRSHVHTYVDAKRLKNFKYYRNRALWHTQENICIADLVAQVHRYHKREPTTFGSVYT